MEEMDLLHLSYSTIHDAAYGRVLEPNQWEHLSTCEDCMLRLADILQVRLDLNDLRKRYSA